MKIGTCDCCEAEDVELVRSYLAGMETWSCWEGCHAQRKKAEVLPMTDAQAAKYHGDGELGGGL